MGTALKNIKEQAIIALFDIKSVLEELDIKFVLLQGTLLGAIRDKDFAPGDEDIDIASKIYNLAPKMKELIPLLRARGFGLKLFDNPYKFYVHAKIKKGGIRTDFLSFDFNGDKAFRLGGRYIDKAKVYDRKLIENLKEIDFLGKKFKVFADAERWLEIEYGPNWKKREHRSGKFTTAWVKDYWKSYVLKAQGVNYGKKIEHILKHKEYV